MKHRFRDDCGAALVEIAVATPLFVLLMMGSLELGRIAYFAVVVQNAARAGASYGAVNVANANLTTTVQQAAKNDAPDVSDLIVVSPGSQCVCETIDPSTNTPSFNPSSGTTSCTSTTITSCTADSATSIQKVIEYVTVSTSANIDPMIHVPGLPSTYTLHGYSALRILQN
ncbi:MAG TPA: TadE family protein [Terracidiphilus sp.]|nr:TadE family protein [Terracidiphilus sp.]